MARKIILGIFPKQNQADEALFHLKEAGFDSDEMSVVIREDRVVKYRPVHDMTGVITGTIIGGLAGLLTASAPIVIPGMGAILIAGPLTAFSGFLTGALAGGLMGALIDIGIPEKIARSYEKRIKEGEALVAVTVTDQSVDEARKILEAHKAKQITVIPYREGAKLMREEERGAAYASEISRKK